MTNPKRPSIGAGVIQPSGGLSRKSSTNVSYVEDKLSWTPEQEAELDRAKAALRAANKKWSPEQEHWIPEVERLEGLKRAYFKALRKSERPSYQSDSRRPSVSAAVGGLLFRSRTSSPTRPISSASGTGTTRSGASWTAAAAAAGDATAARPTIKTRRFPSFKHDNDGESLRLGRSKSWRAATPTLSRSYTISGDNQVGDNQVGNNQVGDNQGVNNDDDDDDDDQGTHLRRVKTAWSGKSEGAVSNRSVLMSRLGRGLRLGRRRWS